MELDYDGDMSAADGNGTSNGTSKEQFGQYFSQISEVGILILRSLVGRKVHRVYAGCLQVSGAHFTAPHFSIPISDEIEGRWIHRYIIFGCEWFETPITFTDYWQMFVSDEDKPKDIEVDSTSAIVAPCTINYYGAAAIRAIEIYGFSWSAGEKEERETVTYDQSIRFLLEDGRSFCIACQLDGPGVATEVHISEDEETIRSLLEGSRLRLTITAAQEVERAG